LLRAIEKSKTLGPNAEWVPDIRLGLYFRDASGQVRHTVFTNPRYWLARYRNALIDESYWKLKGGLIRFAEAVGSE
jgi:hypothetical protein